MRLTASGLDRALACPGSTVLPQRPHSGTDAETGSDVHAFLEHAQRDGREQALERLEDPEFRERCAAIDLRRIPAGAEPETPFAYDPSTDRAERLVLGAPRAYGTDGRIYGTADLVGVDGDRVWVGDYKTGTKKVDARDSMQLRFLALAAARVAGLEAAHVEMLYLRHDGGWFIDAAEFDGLDLDETRGLLRRIGEQTAEARRVLEAGGLPQLVPGPHCEHCAAAVHCPAQDAQQKALVAVGEAGNLVEWFAALDEARAGAMAEQAITVAKLADKVREAANARASEMPEGLPLPSGRTLKRVQYGAQVMSPEAKDAVSALREDLRQRGLITTEKTWQVRVVGGARRSK